MPFKEDVHFNFLPVMLGIIVNTSNARGSSQTQQGMPAIQRAWSEPSLYSTEVGVVAFYTSLYCENIP